MPLDPDELVRWAETYGHPEEWAKRAQDTHARAERLQRRADWYEDVLQEVVKRDEQATDLDGRHHLSIAARIAQEALDGA